MLNGAADLLDNRVAMQLQSSHKRLIACAESERHTAVYIITSRHAIDDSRHLLASPRDRKSDKLDSGKT
jgi:hypothetical protein